jgi:hypothetical protein
VNIHTESIPEKNEEEKEDGSSRPSVGWRILFSIFSICAIDLKRKSEYHKRMNIEKLTNIINLKNMSNPRAVTLSLPPPPPGGLTDSLADGFIFSQHTFAINSLSMRYISPRTRALFFIGVTI